MKKVLAALLLALVACGKRGDPHPPLPVIPKATSDLVVAQRGAKVLLTWSYPSLTTAGKNLENVRRVVLYRYIEELPVQQPPRDTATLVPGDTDPNLPQPMALFAKVPPVGPAQFAKLRTRIDSIEGANLPASTTGSRLEYEDSPPFHTSDGRPVRVNYAVVTEGVSATSDLSNMAVIIPLDVAVPPAGLTATASASGVVLTWEAPKTSITANAKPFISGYNIYRAAPGQPDDLLTPVNAALVTATTYTDVPPYGTFSYRVTAVGAPGKTRIESESSPAVSATFKDLTPPAAPTGLTALVETNAVRLVWDSVDAPDLAGYRIYRTEGTGQAVLRPVGRNTLTPAPYTATNFRDTGVSQGISYFYEVTAVDKSGNESAPAKTDWVLVPKTP